ncbi:uncharacterized protein LOC100370040 [Saccoglossus kowalevskii]|uniref:Uncharacterized protein LOC100370040 n=1 Tax=Saccoglossus kowalevskii TaxID=10224 RepID=A0ABM0MZU9_SACKO|nr:PREDICTED: uncharacterized protein LOC100370040 [Saccoglossus kowalevskii]
MSGVEDIRWSAITYGLKDLADKYTFPKIVKVTRGFYARSENESLANEQVLRIHRVQSQPRVVAVDRRGRHLSIPVKFRFSKFDVFTNGKPEGDAKYMWDIVEHHLLPVDVQFSSQNDLVFSVQYIDNSVKLDENFGKLTLKTLYDESYLQGNAINNNILDRTVINVPMYCKLSVSVACGFVSGSPDMWQSYQSMLSTTVSNKVDFKHAPGSLDISLFSERSLDSVELHHYEEIQPSGTLTIQSRSRGHMHLTESTSEPNIVRLPPTLPQRHPSMRGFKPDFVPTTSHLSPSKVEEMPIGSKYNIYHMPRKQDIQQPRPATFSAASARGIDPNNFSYNVPDKSLARKNKSATEGGYVQLSVRGQVDRASLLSNEDNDDGYEKPVDICGLHAGPYREPPIDIPPPDYDMDTIDRQMIRRNSHLGVIVGRQLNVNVERIKSTPDYTKTRETVDSGISRQNSAKSAQSVQQHQDISHCGLMSELTAVQNKRRSRVGSTSSEISIQPKRHDAMPVPRKYKSLSEIPPMLAGLTVDDVTDCMILLRLESYIDKFRNHFVDGEMLLTLDKQTLMNDLEMTEIDATRLKMFTQGWRPK